MGWSLKVGSAAGAVTRARLLLFLANPRIAGQAITVWMQEFLLQNNYRLQYIRIGRGARSIWIWDYRLGTIWPYHNGSFHLLDDWANITSRLLWFGTTGGRDRGHLRHRCQTNVS